MKFQPTIPQLLYFGKISYFTAIVGGVGVGVGLQSYVQQHQPLILEDYLSLCMLIGGAAMAYKSHQKRLELEQQELEQLQQKETLPPYLYFPRSLDSIVQTPPDNASSKYSPQRKSCR